MSSDDNHNVSPKYGSSFKKFLARRRLSSQSVSSLSTVGDGETSMGSVSVSGRPLIQKKKIINVILPTQDETQIEVETKAKVQELFDQIIALLGIQETQFFGLAIQQDGEFEFLDFKLKLSKYAPKTWKNGPGTGTDKSGKPIFSVYFKVQFYAEHVNLITDDNTRYHYYLQLRHNVLETPLPCCEENYFLLSAYALQADTGNYLSAIHKKNYFEPEKYFPKWVIERRGEDYILNNIPAMHRDQRGMSKTEAHIEFIKHASSCREHVMHFYSVKKNKSDSIPYILVGICTKGLQIYYEDVGGTKYLKYEYPWNSIRKLHFEKKKFEIQAEGVPESRKLVYHCASDSRAKTILQLCKVTHVFQVHTQVIVDKLKKIDQVNEKKKYRESYVSGDLEWELEQMLAAGSSNPESELQRHSVISTGSSNTTSGIVSDDKLEPVFDKSLTEEDEEIEHMITDPPFVDLGGVNFEFAGPVDQDFVPRGSLSFTDSESGLAMNPLELGEFTDRYALTQPIETSILLEETPIKVRQSMEQRNRHSQGYFSITGQSEHTDSEWSLEEDMETILVHRSNVESTPKDAVAATTAFTPVVQAAPTSAEPRHEIQAVAMATSVEESLKPRQVAEQSVQEELKKLRKSKEAETNVPLLSALCNDKSLLALAQKQQDGVQPDTPPLTRQETTESHASSTSSTLKEKASRNTSLNTLIVDSNSSVESENNSKAAEGLEHYRSCLGSLNKHQTLPTLSGAGRLEYEGKLHIDTALANSADGKIKCQTLPAKMSAGGHVIPVGHQEDIFREDKTSFSAPNLSPQPLVVSPGC
ncbi:radixin-like isoform X2 [Ptychodera flava]|uniref:radixin-like isoform X2 n=1 Tax=Ptychodera flava TaxID=63121 RepID=UPI003969C0D7